MSTLCWEGAGEPMRTLVLRINLDAFPEAQIDNMAPHMASLTLDVLLAIEAGDCAGSLFWSERDLTLAGTWNVEET